jgi:hypothetical protein
MRMYSPKSHFRTSRDLADNVFERTIPHPRLKTPMRLVDHLYFVAERDGHHLALGTLTSRWARRR